MLSEPSFQVPAREDNASCGLQFSDIPWDELTPEEFDGLDASERRLVLEWRDRFGLTVHLDHEATVHNAEPAEETEQECAASAAE